MAAVGRYTIDDGIDALKAALGLIDQLRGALGVRIEGDRHFESTALLELEGAGGG